VVVVDDEDRENEGDLIMPADMMTPEAMAFLVQHSTGIVCVGMKGEMLDRLQIPLMVPDKDNEEALLTAFTVTVVNYLLSSCSICYGCHHLKGAYCTVISFSCDLLLFWQWNIHFLAVVVIGVGSHDI